MRAPTAALRADDPSSTRPEPSSEGVVAVDVTFEVTNSDTSTLPCPSDLGSYAVRGHLIGPRSMFTGRAAPLVTLYLHGFLVGEVTWTLGGVPGYDHAAEMAKLGQASVTIDRIGWDTPRPNGLLTCTGSAADVAHQIVDRLRRGDYTTARGAPIAFGHIVLAGFETGGAVAQVEAYSFEDIDGLVVIGYHNQGITKQAQDEFIDSAALCARGGENAEDDSPGGGYFRASGDFVRGYDFFRADGEVIDAVLAHTKKNPCGEDLSVASEFLSGPSRLGAIAVPVLLVQPDHDIVFDPAGAQAQRGHYTGSTDVTFEMLRDTGHFPMFEETAPAFRSLIAEWLERRW